ncbi:glycine zipper 2TM domain-containing protein [Porphyrobacter sp. GA68]|uniref:glycine zipper 2TM domain-containing protein n=1 Tax=Porphyrobacter sp. GA68 TaxID=2883480 RepID=UPI00240D50A9|nr:glycine zipper 2TM domain-containing protein [Porphyrobacter sp. GA68]
MITLAKTFAASALAVATLGLSVPATAAPLNFNAASQTSFATAADWQQMNFEHKRKRQGRYEQSRYDRYDRYNDRGRRVYDEPVSRNTRVWQDRDGSYRCRKTDGTIGLIVGGAAGAILGREIDGRGDRSLGTILGAAGGAILGKEVMSRTRCR